MGKSCIKVDLRDGKVRKLGEMPVAKHRFGVCNIGHKVYVVGG